MSGEEEHLSREELVDREHQARLWETEELQRLIEEPCREAEIRWWTAHSWLSSAGLHGSRGWCVSVPVRLMDIEDPRFP
jgi:hypothetical protein